VDRRSLAARERTLLCEARAPRPPARAHNDPAAARGAERAASSAQCLAYALAVQPRVTEADVEALVDLLHSLALRTRGARPALHHGPPPVPARARAR